jgi:hypothetical protein
MEKTQSRSEDRLADLLVKSTIDAIVHDHILPEGSLNRLATNQQDLVSSANRKQLEAFGFKLSEGGAHTSRTVMLSEITRLLEAAGPEASSEDYRNLIVAENVLGKKTEATRLESARRLRELYGLSRKLPIFSLYRQLMTLDRRSAALLSLLVVWARDPLFRATTPAVLEAVIGDRITGNDFQEALTEVYPHQYSPTIIGNIARHSASSWTQSGHLSGRIKKIRTRVQARPAAITLALILAHVAGIAGEQSFSSIWCRLLDVNASESRSLAEQAHRMELLSLRAIDTFLEISFPIFEQFMKGF